MRRPGAVAAVPVVCLALCVLVAGCQSAPRTRPLRTSAVASGSGSTEAVRKQLEGTWTLESFSVADGAGAQKTVPAAGRLTYDAYGNLELSGTLNDPAAAGASATALVFKGRAVVDAAQSRLVLADVTGNVDAAALPATMAPDKVRYYAIEGDTLSLETRDGTRVLARTVWRKAR